MYTVINLILFTYLFVIYGVYVDPAVVAVVLVVGLLLLAVVVLFSLLVVVLSYSKNPGL